MTKRTTEKISVIRWLAILLLIGLFIGDFGFDIMAKPVPKEAYWMLLAIAAGINVIDLRRVLLRVAGVHDTPHVDKIRNEDPETPLPVDDIPPDETGGDEQMEAR